MPYITANPTVAQRDTYVGTIDWNNYSNVLSSDDSYASAGSIIGRRNTYYINAFHFDFAIPTNKRIFGIEVFIERKSSKGTVVDNEVRLIFDIATYSTDNKANAANPWETGDKIITYGGSDDLWGNIITPDMVNSDRFGVVLSANINSGAEAYVDHIKMGIYYGSRIHLTNDGRMKLTLESTHSEGKKIYLV